VYYSQKQPVVSSFPSLAQWKSSIYAVGLLLSIHTLLVCLLQGSNIILPAEHLFTHFYFCLALVILFWIALLSIQGQCWLLPALKWSTSVEMLNINSVAFLG
jgi:hypothetical protein